MSGQPHFELDASMKLFTELTTLAASLVRHLGRHLISAAVDSFSLTIRKKSRRPGFRPLDELTNN
jgi:hypothetical protein